MARAEGASPDRVLSDLPHEDGEIHPAASSSQDPRPPGLEPQLGAGPDSMPRERSTTESRLSDVLASVKGTSLVMRRLMTRLKA